MSSKFISILKTDARVDDQGRPVSTSIQDATLKQLVKDVSQSKADLAQPVDGNNLLSQLDPTHNTISYLFVLLALWKQAQKARQVSDSVIDPTLVFCASFDSVQARYVGPALLELVDALAEYYRQTKDASVIPAIGAAILRLDPAGSTFTSTHLLFLQLCLEAHLPSQALPVLDKDIYSYPSTPVEKVDEQELCAIHETSATFITRSSGLTADITALDVQEYYLLGAHVYIGLQQWPRAKLFLELVLATPAAHVATPLMVEAYKKLILIGLLSTGQPFSDKALVDQQTHKTLSSLSKAYEVVGEVFKTRDLQRLNAEIDVAAQLWADDNNVGLMNQVAESLYRYRVVDLQKTYSTIHVDTIAAHLGLTTSATLSLLTSMINASHIKAELVPSETDPSIRILRFLTHDPHQTLISNADQAAVLQAKYAQIERLSLHVREADRKLAISNAYVEFVRRSKRAEGAGAPGYEDPGEEFHDAGHLAGGRIGAADADENMMDD